MCTARKLTLSVLLCSILLPLSLFAQMLNNGPVKTYAPKNITASVNGQILLTQHENSSIWLSTDAGNNWNCLDEQISQVTDHQCHIVAPYMVNDSTYVFLCRTHWDDGSQFSCVVTEDYGTTFIDRTPTEDIVNVIQNSFIVSSSDEDAWMFETGDYVYYTENAGVTWNSATPFPVEGTYRYPHGLFIDPSDPNRYYTLLNFQYRYLDVTNYASKVYVSPNGPGNWVIDSPFINFNDMFDEDYVYSYDFLPLSNGDFLSALYVDPDGTSWDADNLVTTNANSQFVNRSGGDLSFRELLFEDHSVPGRIYAKVFTSNFIFVSDDYGQTWSEMELNGIPDYDYFSYNTFKQSENGATLYISIDKLGIYKSDDHGVNWEHVPTFGIPSYDEVYTYTTDLLFSNYDTQWYRQPQGSDEMLEFGVESTPDSNNLHSKIIYAHEDTILGVVASYPMIDDLTYRLIGSYDGGQSWETVYNLDYGNVYPIYDVATGYFSILGHAMNGMQISEDFCQTWHTLPHPVLTGVSMWSTSISNYYIHDFYAIISTDTSDYYDVYYYRLGQSADWRATFYPDHSDRRPVILAVPDGLYGLGVDGNVYFYNNYIWEIVGQLPETDRLPSQASYIYNGSDDIIFAPLENSNEVLLSTNSGQSWSVIEMELPGNMNIVRINDIKKDPVRNRIWIESSVGLYWYPFEDLLEVKEGPIQLQPADFDLLTAYPNPFNASTRIRYNLSQPGIVKLDVYDITGRLVHTLIDSYQPAGLQNVFLDGSTLASGTYFIRLNSGNEIRNRKITLVK